MRKFIIPSLIIILGAIAFFFNISYELPVSQVPQEDIYPGVSYGAVNPGKYEVKLVSSKLVSPTRVKLTPNRNHLLITLITGELVALDRTDSGWGEPYLVTKVDTKFPGFPPDEAGLTGIILSNEFVKNGKVFLLYTFQEESGIIQNRISMTAIKEKRGKLAGSKPQHIYQANIAGASSHQITDGLAVEIQGRPHLLFLIGEGFDGKRAQDPSKEAGKVVLIQEDGSNPLGPRPYTENSNVEALGIRNAYVIAKNPADPAGRYLIADTGPDKYDRLIFTQLGSGQETKPLNFGWDGNQEKLKQPIPDPNNPEISDMVIYRLAETRTFTGLAFSSGNKFLATIFGKTAEPGNEPGKEIWLGKLTNLAGQPKVSFTPIIKRVNEADKHLGNPIGLEIDPKTNEFYFADIMEGRLYQVIPKGGD